MPADKTALLLIAYGSALPSGLAALRKFEGMVRDRYPGYAVRWAYTSDNIRTRLAEQVRRKSDSVVKALRRLALERFTAIVAQPLQIVPATENEVVEGVTRSVSRELGVPVSVGLPLLSSPGDTERCAKAMLEGHLPASRSPDEDVICVGHGASHAAQECYAALERAVRRWDSRVHVATLSGDLPLARVLPHLTSRRVWLVPFLSTVGKHTVSDIAGRGPDSLRTCLVERGHDPQAMETGLLEDPAFADIWLSHLDAALAALRGTPVDSAPEGSSSGASGSTARAGSGEQA